MIPLMGPADHIRDGSPRLERRHYAGGVACWIDPAAAKSGILVAFSERTGGVSDAPYDTLNLAVHVGDQSESVDRNRARLLAALGVDALRGRLVTAEQVHGDRISTVTAEHAGAGAYALRGAARIPSTDALLTSARRLPLLMLYADCVPVVLVAFGPRRAICVVHAGWRGALAGLAGSAASALAAHAGCAIRELAAYVGPHIGPCCYEVGDDILSHFCNTFDTIGAVDGRLDLASAVREDLTRAGVVATRIAETGQCTRDHTDRFFSYRAAPVTGRHGALAVITEGEYDEPAVEAEEH